MKVCDETRRRIRLTLAAYAYEFGETLTMTDEEFDRTALEVDLTRKTGNKRMDEWWQRNFAAHTGLWVRNHPELERAKDTYRRLYGEETTRCCGFLLPILWDVIV